MPRNETSSSGNPNLKSTAEKRGLHTLFCAGLWHPSRKIIRWFLNCPSVSASRAAARGSQRTIVDRGPTLVAHGFLGRIPHAVNLKLVTEARRAVPAGTDRCGKRMPSLRHEESRTAALDPGNVAVVVGSRDFTEAAFQPLGRDRVFHHLLQVRMGPPEFQFAARRVSRPR